MGGGSEAVNEDCLIQINGGTIRITAGGDCLDSNGNLEINGGKVYALAWGNGNEAVDANGTSNTADGTLIIEGSAPGNMQGDPQGNAPSDMRGNAQGSMPGGMQGNGRGMR